jgi:hypothetical protein
MELNAADDREPSQASNVQSSARVGLECAPASQIQAKQVFDPIDLMLLQSLEDLEIERLGRCKVVAEGLFDHHPAPLAILFCH